VDLQRGQIPWADQIHPEDRASVLTNLVQVLQSDQHLWMAEYRFRRVDGTYAYVIDHGYVLRDQAGGPYRMIGAKTDITERRHAETMHAVQLSVGHALEKSASLSEAVPTIIRTMCELQGWTVGTFWLVNSQDKTLHCNALWHQAGLPAAHFSQIYQGLVLQQGDGLAGRVWKTGNAILCPDILNEADFPAFHEAREADLHGGIAFPIDAGKEILGIMEFLTYERLRPSASRLEQVGALGAMITQFLHRKDLERQVRQAQKMDALGRMAGGIAHDFNNLLTIINSWAEILTNEPGQSIRTQRGMSQIKDAGNKAAALTQQLLSFTRHQIVERQPLNLNDRVTDIVELMKRVIGDNVQLVVTLDPTLGQIKADPGQMEQVIMNLVVNARDAMPQGGCLELETKAVSITHSDSFTPDPLIPGSYVMLAVRDTGCGMEADTLAQVFDPFFTTKELGKGTGLGLSTVYGIVRQSGGVIGIESKPGCGTTFTIYLPRIAEDADQPEPVVLPQSPLEHSKTILLVEDNDMVRGLAHTVLVAQHHTVLLARTGEEALEMVHQREDSISLLITDMVMPGMGGLQLATQLRKLQPTIKIILTSGYSDCGEGLLEKLDAQTAFIPKPYTPDSLIKAVGTALDSRLQD